MDWAFSLSSQSVGLSANFSKSASFDFFPGKSKMLQKIVHFDNMICQAINNFLH